MSETPKEIIDQILIDTHEFVERALAVEAERDRLREALRAIEDMATEFHTAEMQLVADRARAALAEKEARDE